MKKFAAPNQKGHTTAKKPTSPGLEQPKGYAGLSGSSGNLGSRVYVPGFRLYFFGFRALQGFRVTVLGFQGLGFRNGSLY